MVKTRIEVNGVDGESVTLDVVDGCWVDPTGSADQVLGEGMWALPGLVDSHAHFAREKMDYLPGDPEGSERRAREALSGGVMLALDKGWRDLTVVEMIDRVAAEVRPDIESAGVTHAVPGGYFPGFAREIAPGELEAVVRTAAAESVGWVKLIGDWPRKGIGPQPNFDGDELAEVVRIAGEAGARVAIHTMARDVPSMAVAAGVQSIEHGLFLAEDDIAELGEREGIWVPTLLQMEAVIAQLGEASSGGRLLVEGVANASRLLPLAMEAGVQVLTGTDMVVPVARVFEEALRLAEAGLSPRQVIDAVAYAGFRATGREPFAVGAPANVVLFAANPLEDLGVLGHPWLVMRHGKQVA